MNEKLKQYIKKNLVVEKRTTFRLGKIFESIKDLYMEDEIFDQYDKCEEYSDSSISNYIDKNKNENLFQKLLFKYIDDKNLKDSDVYNKVHIDRRLFSKIRSNPDYHPSKETIILLGLSLELNENEIVQLLESASYSLPKNNYYDLIIRFCFVEGIYKIKDVNELLASYDCKLFYY